MAEQTHFALRPKKYYRNLAIACLVFFGGMMVFSTCVLLREENLLAAIVIPGIWVFFIGLAVWMLLAYWRESLRIQDGTIVQKGVVRTKALNLAELVDLRWRMSRSVVLRSKDVRITIYLDNFNQDEQRQLIRFIRVSVPYPIQRGWDRFCYSVALPLVECSDDRPLRKDDVLRTRWHFDRLFLPIIPLATALGIWFAWYLEQSRWLLVPVPFALLWLLIRATVPAKGLVVRKQSGSDRRFALELAAWAAVGIGVIGLLQDFGRNLPWPSLWPFLWILLWMCGLVVSVYRADQRRWQRLAGEIDLAVQEWEQHEGVSAKVERLGDH